MAELLLCRGELNIYADELQNWYSDTTEFYSNAEDNMLYIMSDGNQGTYGAIV